MSRQDEIAKVRIFVDNCRGLSSDEFARILVDSGIGTKDRFVITTGLRPDGTYNGEYPNYTNQKIIKPIEYKE